MKYSEMTLVAFLCRKFKGTEISNSISAIEDIPEDDKVDPETTKRASFFPKEFKIRFGKPPTFDKLIDAIRDYLRRVDFDFTLDAEYPDYIFEGKVSIPEVGEVYYFIADPDYNFVTRMINELEWNAFTFTEVRDLQ
jgi:hypothetical protein